MSGLSVVIVTYRPGREVLDCVRSLKQMVNCPHEIIIVDNSPELPEIIECISNEIKDIQVISNPSNPGFGTANNAGAALARYPHLLFLNPDTVLCSELDNIDQFFSHNTGIVSGYCIDAAGKYKRTAGIFPTDPKLLVLFSRRLDRRPPLDNGNFTLSEVEVDYAEGSFYLIRADVFRETGGFDEGIFLYGEDYEFSYRVHLAGYRNKIVRAIEYLHVGGFNDSREPHIVNGLLYFATKHLAPRRAAGVRGVLAMRFSVLLVASMTIGVFKYRYRKRVPSLAKCLARVLQP